MPTDDTPAINAAIAKVGQAGGGPVDLDGTRTYNLAGGPGGISVGYSNTWLRGNGARIKLLNRCSEDIIKIFSGGPLQNSGVSDLIVDAGNFAVAGRGAVNLNTVTFGGFVKNITVLNQGTQGISVQGCNDFKVTDNYCKLNVAMNSQNHGILVTENIQQNYGLIARNRCVNTNMEIDGAYLTIDENTIFDFKYGSGITMGPSDRTFSNTVSNNKCFNGAGVDVDITYCAGFELWTPRSTVTGNMASGNSGNGFMLGGDRMTVTGNGSFNNGQSRHSGDSYGFFAQWNGRQGGTNCTVDGNTAGNFGGGNTQTYGFAENQAVSGNVIGVNNFSGNATGPMLLNKGTRIAVMATN